MKEIYINVDEYNSDVIKTTEGNNNAEFYKLYLQYDNEKIDLTGKRVNLAFLKLGTTEGDIIENLTISNAKEGEVTLNITNRLTKQNGTYTCQLAIIGEGDFIEHTATFSLEVENNIFAKIVKELADSKDFTYLESLLSKASNLNTKLKESTEIAEKNNSLLSSNIEKSTSSLKNSIEQSNAINSKLENNNAVAREFNNALAEKIEKAKNIKTDIKNLDNITVVAKARTEEIKEINSQVLNNIKELEVKAVEKTEEFNNNSRDKLEKLNSKALEIDRTINRALPIKEELEGNTKQAIAINKELGNNNKEALEKDKVLKSTLDKAKQYIESLEPNKNIPELKLELENVKNGLKSNQTLAYKGSSISAENTLEGRTQGLKIYGETKIVDGKLENLGEKEKVGDKYKISILSNTTNFVESFENTTTLEAGQYSEYKLINVKLQGELYQGLFKDGEFVSTSGSTVVYFYDESKNQIEWLTLNGKPRLFDWKNILVKAKYYRIYDNSNRIVFDDFFIGKEPTYSKSKLDKKDILIKEPLRSVGNIQDVLYEDNGQVKINRYSKQYLITGDENIQTNSNFYTNKTLFFFFDLQNANKKSSSINICNRFPSYPTDMRGIIKNQQGEGCFIGDNNSGLVQFYINKDKLTTPDVNGFKAWLKANPTTVIYQLATPVTEIVENCVDIDLDTFQDKTYFNILNSIKGSLDFKVPSNIASIVQSNSKAINELYNLIDTLVLPNILQNTTDIEMLKLEKLK